MDRYRRAGNLSATLHHRYVVMERHAGARPFLLCVQQRCFLPPAILLFCQWLWYRELRRIVPTRWRFFGIDSAMLLLKKKTTGESVQCIVPFFRKYLFRFPDIRVVFICRYYVLDIWDSTVLMFARICYSLSLYRPDMNGLAAASPLIGVDPTQ